jgi:hypothetical protein
MKSRRISVREARKSISKILREGKVTAVGDLYHLRGFIVPMPPHERWNPVKAHAAFNKARANFIDAWIDEQEK